MRKTTITGVAASLALLLGPATAAFAGTSGGQGAQKASIGPASGNASNCATSSGSNGWAILNDPGPAGSAISTEGEVHLVGASPNTTYDIYVGSGSSCTPTGDSVTTNGEGIGNGHINVVPAVTGSAFVALFSGTSEAYATSNVPLQ